MGRVTGRQLIKDAVRIALAGVSAVLLILSLAVVEKLGEPASAQEAVR